MVDWAEIRWTMLCTYCTFQNMASIIIHRTRSSGFLFVRVIVRKRRLVVAGYILAGCAVCVLFA